MQTSEPFHTLSTFVCFGVGICTTSRSFHDWERKIVILQPCPHKSPPIQVTNIKSSEELGLNESMNMGWRLFWQMAEILQRPDPEFGMCDYSIWSQTNISVGKFIWQSKDHKCSKLIQHSMPGYLSDKPNSSLWWLHQSCQQLTFTPSGYACTGNKKVNR